SICASVRGRGRCPAARPRGLPVARRAIAPGAIGSRALDSRGGGLMRSATLAPSLRDRIRAQLADLKMPGALEALDDILAGLDGGTLQPQAALEALLASQIALRNNRRLQAAMRSSRLPVVKTLADFDFSFQP